MFCAFINKNSPNALCSAIKILGNTVIDLDMPQHTGKVPQREVFTAEQMYQVKCVCGCPVF